MRVLVACEFSGHRARRVPRQRPLCVESRPPAVRGRIPLAFPAQNVTGLLRFGPGKWDLMIAHPPCQFLCNSSVRWLYKPDKQRDHWR